ncbi:gamma-glutamylcyclotransferase [Microvirga sp. VF16]|uniref:gamma-glutamylcyclotransferase n=1 Tax=Microvirga sp. VF16 TaxID=2807101 RepID=UPI00193CBA0F|nr:gamma-glutamylcyclotransferase [Microvirga sp. VF16]QRM35366.1 gamma-glutamylcyclotransferase [Microvirga sp. VF16]
MLVFAYGSLIWNPGFDYESTMPALAPGWRRSWCIPSTVHRGSADSPGVVLGLVPGPCCIGIAYEVAEAREAAVRRYLVERETAEDGYVDSLIDVLTPRGWDKALCYVADLSNPSVRELSEAGLLSRLRTAWGRAGTNADYARNTIAAVMTLPRPLAWPEPCPGMALRLAGILCGNAVAEWV